MQRPDTSLDYGRRLQRVAVGGLGSRRALDQAHGGSVGDVDGGEQHERGGQRGS